MFTITDLLAGDFLICAMSNSTRFGRIHGKKCIISVWQSAVAVFFPTERRNLAIKDRRGVPEDVEDSEEGDVTVPIPPRIQNLIREFWKSKQNDEEFHMLSDDEKRSALQRYIAGKISEVSERVPEMPSALLRIREFVTSVQESTGNFGSASDEEKRAAIRELVEVVTSERSDVLAENRDGIEAKVSRIQSVLESSAEHKVSIIRDIIAESIQSRVEQALGMLCHIFVFFFTSK